MSDRPIGSPDLKNVELLDPHAEIPKEEPFGDERDDLVTEIIKTAEESVCPHCLGPPHEHVDWEPRVEEFGAEKAAAMVADGDLDCPPLPDGVRLVRASAIRPEPVEFIEEGLIPLAAITLVVGIDGVGKTTMLSLKAAQATRGTLPGDLKGRPVDVVVASAEDPAAQVTVPRLVAAGADLDRVHIVKVTRAGLDGDVSLPDDLDDLAAAVRQVDARLLIVDPLVAHMPLHVDSHKAQHVRSVLAPLGHLAEESRLAVCAVIHFNGSPSTDVRTRISGSKAFRDAARSVLVCGADPSDEHRYVVVQDKNSYGPRAEKGRAYRIEGITIQHAGVTVKTSRIVWLGDVAIDGRRLLAAPPDDEERSGRELARDVILGVLEGGLAPWAELKKAAASEGVSGRTARRARDELRSHGLVDKKKAGSGGWSWDLTGLGQEHVAKLLKDKLKKIDAPSGSGSSEEQLGHSPDTGQVQSEEPDALTDPFEFEVWLDEEAQSDIPPPRPAEAEPDKAEADDAAGVTHGRS